MDVQPARVDSRRRAWALGAGLALVGGLATWAALRRTADDDRQVHAPVAALPVFPELAVVRLDGARERLAAEAGQVRVVNFWARWCGPCRRELPALHRMASKLAATPGEARIVLQTIALDDDAFALREYVHDLQLDRLPVWRMPPGESASGLALDSLPLTFVVGADARILARIVGAREWDSDEQIARVRALARGPVGEG